MKKIIYLLMILTLAFCLASCSTGHIEGEVIDKEFKEAHTQTVLLPTTIFNGKTTTIILIPYIRQYPNRWKVTVRWFEKDRPYHEDIWITQECYESVHLGDWFFYDEDYCYPQEPYEQRRQ